MRRILVVAGATIREHSRRRTLVFFGVAAAATTAVVIYLVLAHPELASLLGSDMSLTELISFGLFGLLATIGTLVVSMGNIRPLFASGEADATLSRPISRVDLVAGRTLASLALVIASCATFAAASQIISVIAGEGISASLAGHWASEAFNLILLCLMTTLISGWSNTPAIGAVCGFFVGQMVAGIQALYLIVEGGALGGPLARFIEAAWWSSPKYLPSPLLSQAGVVAQPSLDWTLVLWGVGWLFLILALIVRRATRMEAA